MANAVLERDFEEKYFISRKVAEEAGYGYFFTDSLNQDVYLKNRDDDQYNVAFVHR